MDKDARSDAFGPGDTLAKGDYRRGGPSDLRGPCPMLNALANHGYLPRDGRNIYRGEVYSAMRTIGLSTVLAAFFCVPPFLVRKNLEQTQTSPQLSWIVKIWKFIRDPISVIFANFGIRPEQQVDSSGNRYLNIDQFTLRDVVEHDISLTRYDLPQGDNHTPQPELIADLLAASSDGGKHLSIEDLIKFRLHRIETQKRENKSLHYGRLQHEMACGETALILKVLGDGHKVRCDVVRALLAEERLPLKEGWTGKRWWTIGLAEIQLAAYRVKSATGLKF